MGKQYSEIPDKQIEFIKHQKLFFVGTAANDGRVNISPKGMDTFRVINSKKIVWLNLTGSGNETAAHLLKSNRMTIMFCAFEGKPNILRLYGQARIYHNIDAEYSQYINLFPNIAGSRQIIELDVDLVQTSCGYAVPYMDFKEERNQLKVSMEKKGEDRIKTYWEEKNAQSIDGFKTEIEKNLK
ncbi:pyridoxamine 5'-phosphate oxidase family protein [Hanstruepera marina]|uniref:pyridoxamine 5'-phosphate oxidase family protein n=1 Tax=Hanstruepera marina TaxID=2873265 RepID=UPI001CA7946F|nr:pyridoxamine 5'-phosphate oxidase family protein [Hanstruepera marina]